MTFEIAEELQMGRRRMLSATLVGVVIALFVITVLTINAIQRARESREAVDARPNQGGSPVVKKETSDSADDILTVPIDSPEILDLLWERFFATGDEAAVLRIVSVLDWDDGVRGRLEAWLAEIEPGEWEEPPYSGYRQMFIQNVFPIDYQNRTIDDPLDVDLHVALLVRNGELKFDDLPVSLSPEECLRLAMKSAALWSLRSVAKENDVVARLCDQESKKPGGAARMHLAAPAEPQE